MNNQKGIGVLGIILVFAGIIVIGLGSGMGLRYYQDRISKKPDTQTSINQPVACTQEAKICPDGSSVGRTGPNCEFAECPIINKETIRREIQALFDNMCVAFKNKDINTLLFSFTDSEQIPNNPQIIEKQKKDLQSMFASGDIENCNFSIIDLKVDDDGQGAEVTNESTMSIKLLNGEVINLGPEKTTAYYRKIDSNWKESLRLIKDFEVYTNDTYKFSFKYPKEFSIKLTEKNKIWIEANSIKGSDGEDWSVQYLVTIFENKENSDLATWYQNYFTKNKKPAGYTITKQEQKLINSYDALIINTNKLITEESVIFSRNNFVYIFETLGPIIDHPVAKQRKSFFDFIINSVVFY